MDDEEVIEIKYKTPEVVENVIEDIVKYVIDSRQPNKEAGEPEAVVLSVIEDVIKYVVLQNLQNSKQNYKQNFKQNLQTKPGSKVVENVDFKDVKDVIEPTTKEELVTKEVKTKPPDSTQINSLVDRINQSLGHELGQQPSDQESHLGGNKQTQDGRKVSPKQTKQQQNNKIEGGIT